MFAKLRVCLPTQCRACHAWDTGGALCWRCQEDFAPQPPQERCPRCGLLFRNRVGACEECQITPPVWERCYVGADYAYPWAGLIGQWKFGGEAALVKHLFRYLLYGREDVEEAVQNCDYLVPIPISRRRLKTRGFNQAAQIAQLLDPQKCRPHYLERRQESAIQHHLGRQERLENLREVFYCAETPPEDRMPRILLVDDVMTTGATFNAACKAINKKRASTIDVLCLARTA